MNWLPMTSAPKDGTMILLACPYRVEIGKWDDCKYSSFPRPYWKRNSVFGVKYERDNQPTAWMPLPILPRYQQ